jgi:hypothetical protein
MALQAVNTAEVVLKYYNASLRRDWLNVRNAVDQSDGYYQHHQ